MKEDLSIEALDIPETFLATLKQCDKAICRELLKSKREVAKHTHKYNPTLVGQLPILDAQSPKG